MSIVSSFFIGAGKKSKLVPGDDTLSMMKNYTGKAPDKKAVESIKKWCDPQDDKWEPVIVKNVPTSGIKVASYVERYRTNNKWFEAVDPRGFKLQISVADFLNLMLDTTIINGVIQEECVWGYSGTPYLINVHGKKYKHIISKQTKKEDRVKVTSSKLVLGDTYLKDGNMYYVYLGKVNIDMVTDKSKNYNGGHYGWNNYSKDLPDLPLKTEVRDNFIFAEVYGKNLNQPLDRLSVNITKTCPKVYETDKSSTIQISDFASALDKKALSIYSLPTSKIPKELRAYRFTTVPKSLEIPAIGFSKIY